ncbi:signal peptidase II [Patescibacteria group bacterium]|nr:signal peptidase II [Patescibacteria group bacterium]MBU4000286.1 signal peptidase II [Patescibacteria group bacterium]MBU4057096.1 signal peptidase II [Patescibacteria group bacterium]MBU4368474.1 signal peptidase II [Patescibacteria group bacterium]
MNANQKIFLAIAVFGVLSDQIVKKAALVFLSGRPLYAGDFLGLEVYKNYGAAFGAPVSAGIFYPAVLIFLAALLYAWPARLASAKRAGKMSRVESAAFSLVFAGALSNTIDRVSLGYIVDFISINRLLFFNFADAMIVIGAVIILNGLLRKK